MSDADLEMDECKVLVNHVISQGDIMYLFDSNERNDLVEKMRTIDLQKEKSLQVSVLFQSMIDLLIRLST